SGRDEVAGFKLHQTCLTTDRLSKPAFTGPGCARNNKVLGLSGKIQAQQSSHHCFVKPPIGMVVDVGGGRLLAESGPPDQPCNLALLAVLPFPVNERSHHLIEAEFTERIVS